MKTVKLSDVCTIDYGTRVVRKNDEGTEYDVYGGGGKTFKVDIYNREDCTIVSRFAMSPTTVRKVKGKFFLNDSGLSVSTKDKDILDQSYVDQFLFYANDQIYSLGRGSAQRNLDMNAFRSMLISFPESLEEQRKIVARLDTAFERISAAEVLMRRNLDNVAALQKSILHKYLSAPDSTHTHRLGDICNFVRGPFGGTLKKEYFKPEGYAVYEQRHAIYGMETPIRYFIDENKFEEMKRFEVKTGDLLMSCSGTIGRIAIVPNDVTQGVINQALLKFTPRQDMLDVEYLKYLVESRGFQRAISERSGGSAIQNVASVKILKEIDVAIPSVDTQKKIVSQIENANQKINSLHDKYQKKLTKLTDLRQSLLAEAFMTTSAV